MRKNILILFLFVSAVTAVAQKKTLGPHGGVVNQANGNYKIELLLTSGDFYTFLLDANSKAIDNKNIACHLKLCFQNDCEMEPELKTFGTDGFSASNTKGFYSCTITFDVLGKAISADFYNESNE